MAAIFADNILRCIFFNEKSLNYDNISLKFVLKGSVDNMQALAPVMAWRRRGDKPLSELMIAQITDAYMRNSASLS